MKKFITIFSVGMVFAGAFMFSGSAYALVPPAGCSIPPDHGIYADDMSAIVGCIKAAAWSAAQASGSNPADLPHIANGASVTDEWGFTDSCPFWYFGGCVDVSRTPEYRSAMTLLFGKALR